MWRLFPLLVNVKPLNFKLVVSYIDSADIEHFCPLGKWTLSE